MDLQQKPLWYRVTNLGNSRGEIRIRGIVGISNKSGEHWFGQYEGEGGTVQEFERALTELGPVSEIDLYISSEGGEVAAGLAIHNMLARHPAKIIAHVDGYAFSIASVILQAADERRMPSNALVMIHNASVLAWGDYRDMLREAESLKAHNGAILRAYTAKSKTSRETFQALMDATTYLDGPAARDLGLVDVVTDEVALSACELSPGMARHLNIDRVPEKYRGRFDIRAEDKSRPAAVASPRSSSSPSSSMDTLPDPVPAPAASNKPNVEIDFADEATVTALRTAIQPSIDAAVNAALQPVQDKLTATSKELTETKDKLAAAQNELQRLANLESSGALASSQSGKPVSGTPSAEKPEDKIEALRSELAATKDPKERGRLTAQIQKLKSDA